jgi:hypothetical protein
MECHGVPVVLELPVVAHSRTYTNITTSQRTITEQLQGQHSTRHHRHGEGSMAFCRHSCIETPSENTLSWGNHVSKSCRIPSGKGTCSWHREKNTIRTSRFEGRSPVDN